MLNPVCFGSIWSRTETWCEKNCTLCPKGVAKECRRVSPTVLVDPVMVAERSKRVEPKSRW